MSELDSLSDSDWFDLASRTSDDESIGSHGAISSRPLSRRSSISVDSSHESEVEAWEGFVDESGDEFLSEHGMCLVQPPAAHATDSLPAGSIPDIEQDPFEDQRVKDALDQSVLGTLSSSRTSTSGTHTVHNSVRDLRLTFPDPLTSSRDELNRSYTEIPISESSESLLDEGATILPNETLRSIECEQKPAVEAPMDQHHEVLQPDNISTVMDLDIILYGTSSPIKWSFVQEFLQKAANFSGSVIINALDPTKGPVQTLNLCGKDNSILTSITVHDHTDANPAAAITLDNQDVTHPSLAIVYLPSNILPVLSLHTAYLPVLVPVPADDINNSIGHAPILAAEDDWELLGVPVQKAIKLIPSQGPILNFDALRQVESWRVFDVLHCILDGTMQECKPTLGSPNPARPVKLLALVSIVMSLAFNSAFHTYTPCAMNALKNLSIINNSSLFASHQANRTLSVPFESTSTSIIPSPLRDLALTVFNPGVSSLSVTPQSNSLSTTPHVTSLSVTVPGSSSLSLVHPPYSNTAFGSSSRLPMASSAQASSSKDVILREATPTSLSLSGTTSATRTQKKRSVPNFTSPNTLSLRFVDSISELVSDRTTKALSEVKNIVGAVDGFMNVVQSQSQTVVDKGKGKVRALGEVFVYRHGRARGRAKDAKKRGKELFTSVTTHISEKTDMAKSRARGLREGWRNTCCGLAPAEWAAMLCAEETDKENVVADNQPHQWKGQPHRTRREIDIR